MYLYDWTRDLTYLIDNIYDSETSAIFNINFETNFPPIHQFKNPKWSFEEVHKDRIFSNPKLMITLKAHAELHLFYYKKKGFLA